MVGAKTASKPIVVRITIQPAERPDGVLPYPFMIDAQAGVGRQDFWKGDPLRLICFAKEGMHVSSLSFKDFWKTPKKCIGLYPVFEDKKGEWHTYRDPIQTISLKTV